MDPQLTPGLVIRFLGTYCGASYGVMAAMYSDVSRQKAAASTLPAPHNEEHTHGDTSLPISSSAPSHAPGPAEPLRTVQQLGSHAATQAAKSIADSTFEQLCAIIGPEPGPGWDMKEVGYKQLQHYWLTVRSALNRAGMQLPAPAAPPVSSTAPPGWSMARMKRAEERDGKHKATAGSQPLCGESPERPQPSRAEPLPAVRAQKQLPILEDAVVKHTQHQHRKATQALRQAKENRAASTAKYLAHAAPQILPTQRTAVQPLRDSAGGNIVEEQHHWLLQSMQLTGQLQQLQQPAAPAGRDSLAFRHLCCRCRAREESQTGSQ